MKGKLFEQAPLPWRRDGEDVLAANNLMIYCDQEYYPYSELENEQWDELIELINKLDNNDK